MGGPLSSFATLQRGTTYKSTLLGKPGPYLFGLACIQRNGGFRSDNLKTYGGSSDPRILVGPGELIVSLKDVTQAADLLGAVVRVPDHIGQGRLTQDTVKLVFFGDQAVRDYVYWVLRTPEARAHCRSLATGTTNLGLARNDFLSLQLPPLTKGSRALLELLSALDDKIELNQRMNETLEASARALFRDWFVDFGPTRAKAEGRPAYLAPDLWSLFPDRLDGNGLPVGWEWGALNDMLVLQRGFDLPKSDRTDGAFPVIAASGPSGTHNERRVSGPGVCTGRSGVLGGVYYVAEDFWPLNTSLWIKEYPNSTPLHAFHVLLEIDIGSFNAGSAVPTLNRNHIHNLPVVKPPMQAILGFDKIAGDLYAMRNANMTESRTLVTARDALLPKLMSGELRVRDAEALAA